MAKVLDAFPVNKTATSKWVKYTDGQVWQLTQGEDFDCKLSTADVAFRKAATSRGLSASVRKIDDKTIVVQARKKS